VLVWNPDDVLACLETVPAVEEYDISHTYFVSRDGIRLELTIYQDAGDIYIDLFREGLPEPIFRMTLTGCPGCRHVNDQRGEYLEFAPVRCFGSRYDGNSPIPFGVRLAIKPNISVTLF
jgi:hypothetical protein